MKSTAAGLAALGRGNDSVLVHMTPREVAGLQQLAMAHGGSLTTNPHTGLPEAGFLSDILPAVVGVGLTMMGVPAWGVGLGSGLTSLATGKDAGSALMSGLLAGGGAALFGPGSAAGENIGSVLQAAPTTGSAAADTALQQFTQTAPEMGASLLGPAPTYGVQGLMTAPPPLASAGATLAESAPQFLTEGLTTAPQTLAAPQGYFDRLGAGLKAVADQPMQFLKDNQYAAGALGLGAMGALGGFEQPELQQLPGQARSTARLSGPIRRPYDPNAPEGYYFTDRGIIQPAYAAKGGEMHSVPQLEDGGFVLTKKAVDGMGKGSNERGQRAAAAGLGAIPIKGPGTGTSDSISTNIDGVRPAKVSNGEAYVPRKRVKQAGGAKKLYALMRQAETEARRRAA